MAVYKDQNGKCHKRLKSLDEPTNIQIADKKKLDKTIRQLSRESKTYEHNQKILKNQRRNPVMNFIKKFLSYTAICIIIAFINFNFRAKENEIISSYILLISSVIIAIKYTKKNKIRITNKNLISSFLEENENQIRDNAKYNRRLDWGIQKETNWKNTWNPLQPKENNTVKNKFGQKIKTFFKFLGIMFSSILYIALLESILIVSTII